MFIRNSKGCVVVTDITNPETLENSIRWRQVVKENGPDNIPIILVQNKWDLVQDKTDQEITQLKSNLENFAAQNDFTGFQFVSAKNKFNVNDLFQDILERALQNEEPRSQNSRQQSNKVSLVSNSTFNNYT